MPAVAQPLTACHCCGLVQTLPPPDPARRILCRRCATPLHHRSGRRNHWAAALAAAALAFYPAAMLLPMMRIEKLGHLQEDSLLVGIATLFGQGYLFVGAVVLAFSVILPLLKLIALLSLTRPQLLAGHAHRALVYRAVEALGRWGMMDVMLMSVLIAFVKVGDLVHIGAGPGLIAFTMLVLTSLLASAAFNPHLMWDEPDAGPSADHERNE